MSDNVRVAAVIVKNGRILLVKRIKAGQTYYVLPGGHPEKNESPEEALERELSEETTLDIRVEKLLYKLERPTTKSQELYYLCSTDNEYLELDRTSKEYQETIQGKNIYVPMWVDLSIIPKLKFFPFEIRNLIIKQGFPSRFYKYSQDKYIHPPGNTISKPHYQKIINKALDDISRLIETSSRYVFGFLALLNFSLMVIAYYGEIRVELPSGKIYIGDESKIKLVSGSFWPTVIYITRDGYILEILPKNLIFNKNESTYYSKTSGLWKSYRLEGNLGKYSYHGGVNKWIPVVFFTMLTSLFLFLTFSKKTNKKRVTDNE